jgi:uncharacterized protein
MKLIIVGAGVSGLYAAWHLGRDHEVILLEADSRPGGHADTQVIEDDGRSVPVDTGFIVFNERHYPLFSAWLDELGVAWKTSDMSFAVSDLSSGLEYNATSMDGLFCQRRNLFRPAFLGMVRDIVRFYRMAPGLLDQLDDRVTLGEWLADSAMGEMFAEMHLLPMASALWSAPMDRIRQFPMRHLLAFMDNHAMLELGERPPWRTIEGGSRVYVEAAVLGPARIETGIAVRSIQRLDGAVKILTDRDEIIADGVVLACHSDQALKLLSDADRAERSILGAIAYQDNETVLHTDSSLLPRLPKARASWNVRRDGHDGEQCRVTYYMNRLQGIQSDRDYIVSLNQTELINPDRILVRRPYRHPVFTPDAVIAQRRWSEINGLRQTWFCGAWWGWGFHEDGVASAARVIEHLASDNV